MMDTMSRDGRWFGFLAAVCFLTTVFAACSSGGGSGGGTGLPSGTACVTVNDGAEVCAASGVTADRTISSEIHISVDHLNTADCFARAADEFFVRVTIPDGLPFPYQATQRQGDAQFGTGPCGWLTNEASVVSGTVYQAGTNGSTHVEGDVTVPYNANNPGSTDNRNYQCGTGCPASALARFRFNLPL